MSFVSDQGAGISRILSRAAGLPPLECLGLRRLRYDPGALRALLIVAILFSLILLVFVPLSLLWTARSLPQLDSEFDLDRHLRGYIEGERMGARAGMAPGERAPVDWPRPDLAKYPKELVALWISSWDCPTFFQTPRETGAAWLQRLAAVELLRRDSGGDGRCERIFANNLAAGIRIPRGQAQAVATHKIHNLLHKDQLVAYNLATVVFERSIIGVEDGARRLFKRELETLKLEELAELMLAMPPHYYYEDLRVCRNPSLIRQARDLVIGELAYDGLIPEDRARAAMAQPVACTNVR